MPPPLVSLPDGRRLAYAEYGDPSGTPVIHCHGGFSSRLDGRVFDAAGRRAGLRVISPDRPGVGASDPQPGRTLLDWPGDIAALADALGFETFALTGWSAGGPYALACAVAIPARVTAVGLIASAMEIVGKDSRRDLNRPDRVLLNLAERAPWAMAGLLRAIRVLPPGVMRAGARSGAGPADAAILAQGSAAEATAYVRESIRPGPRGVIQDYVVFGAPWGFGLSAVAQPVRVWQGDADTLVPMRHAEALAAGLPNATLTVVAGEGHLSLAAHKAEEILASLVG